MSKDSNNGNNKAPPSEVSAQRSITLNYPMPMYDNTGLTQLRLIDKIQAQYPEVVRVLTVYSALPIPDKTIQYNPQIETLNLLALVQHGGDLSEVYALIIDEAGIFSRLKIIVI